MRCNVLRTPCPCSAWLCTDGVSAEYALRREDLHAVEGSQRDQRGHHAVRGQSKPFKHCSHSLAPLPARHAVYWFQSMLGGFKV